MSTRKYAALLIAIGLILIYLGIASCASVEIDKEKLDEKDKTEDVVEEEEKENEETEQEKQENEEFLKRAKKISEKRNKEKEKALSKKEKELSKKEKILEKEEQELRRAQRLVKKELSKEEEKIEEKLADINAEMKKQARIAYLMEMRKRIEEDLRGTYKEGRVTTSPLGTRPVYKGPVPYYDLDRIKIVDPNDDKYSYDMSNVENAPVFDMMKDKFKLVYERGKKCCGYNLASELEQTNINDKLIYKFLVDDVNFYKAYNNCIFMSEQDILDTFAISETARMVENVRNECVCNNKEALMEDLEIFRLAYKQNPKFRSKHLYLEAHDEFGRVEVLDVNYEVNRLIYNLNRCPN